MGGFDLYRSKRKRPQHLFRPRGCLPPPWTSYSSSSSHDRWLSDLRYLPVFGPVLVLTPFRGRMSLIFPPSWAWARKVLASGQAWAFQTARAICKPIYYQSLSFLEAQAIGSVKLTSYVLQALFTGLGYWTKAPTHSTSTLIQTRLFKLQMKRLPM